MLENNIKKQLNADAQESASTENVEVTTATTNEPVETAPVAEKTVTPVIETAHDDFDWSVDRRNVISYSAEERENYHKV